MNIDKFKAADRALKRFEKLYGPEVIEVFSVANGEIHLDNDLFERLWQNNDYMAIVIKKSL